MKKVFKFIILIIILMITVLVSWVFTNLSDRHTGYNADMKVINETYSELCAGFAAVQITPEVPDSWIDANNDTKYNPNDGDTFTDGNGNGKFDAVWIAGFSNNKPANGIHDDTWARTMIIDDSKTRLAIVVLDVIGFMHDDVVDIRKMIPEDVGITYAIISSTHTHEGPDLLGLWGKTFFKSGVDKEYMKFVKKKVVQSILEAAGNLRPVRLEISEDLTSAIPLVKDTRQPEVFDSGIRIIKAVDKENGISVGSLIAWGNHPETLWSGNLLVSSDFPHYLREGIEKGVYNGDSLFKKGIGGISVYASAAVGGLMTTHPSIAVRDPFTGIEFKAPTYEKTEAQGKHLALIALEAMENPSEVIESGGISLLVRTLIMPIDNNLFKLVTALGVMDRGTVGWMKMRTELSVFKIGPVSFATIPGEIYPEILNGGVEAPEGRDFKIDPVEVPAIRAMMPGKYKFVLGIANDEIGYIVPKSQWDVEAPFGYGKEKAQYGEQNSLGAETAPVLHQNLMEMLLELGE